MTRDEERRLEAILKTSEQLLGTLGRISYEFLHILSESAHRELASNMVEVQRAIDEIRSKACEDHEWVSADNERVTGIELCLTCYHKGVERVPIRKAEN